MNLHPRTYCIQSVNAHILLEFCNCVPASVDKDQSILPSLPPRFGLRPWLCCLLVDVSPQTNVKRPCYWHLAPDSSFTCLHIIRGVHGALWTKHPPAIVFIPPMTILLVVGWPSGRLCALEWGEGVVWVVVVVRGVFLFFVYMDRDLRLFPFDSSRWQSEYGMYASMEPVVLSCEGCLVNWIDLQGKDVSVY